MPVVTRARIIHIPGDPRRDANVDTLMTALRAAGFTDVAAFEGVRPDDRGPMYSVGEWGCYQSHVALTRFAASTGEPLMILEDDAVLSCKPGELAELLQQAEPAKWNVLNVGYLSTSVFRDWDADLMSHPTIPVRGEMWGCQCYVVRPDRLDEIAQFLAELPYMDRDLGGGVGADGAWCEAAWHHPWMLRRAAPKSLFHTIPGITSTLRRTSLGTKIKDTARGVQRRLASGTR
jgi:hypothetical protein